MTKAEHVAYWIKSAEDDFDTMNYLFKGSRYVHSLYFGHLFMEKISKAIWIKNNEDNHPPKIHNLIKLLSGINTGLNENDLLFLDELNIYQLEGRYPDYTRTLFQRTTQKIAEETIEKIKTASQCLQEKL